MGNTTHFVASDNSIQIYDSNGLSRILIRSDSGVQDYPVLDATSVLKPTTSYAKSTGRDVVLIAGQSNALGHGDGLDSKIDYSDPRILQFPSSGTYVGQEILAIDPLIHTEVYDNKVGFPMTFARNYVQSSQPRKLLLVPTAAGGTGFSNNRWNPNDDLAANAVAKTNAALALDPDNKLVAILWHQGEADFGAYTQAQHAAKLDALVDYFRANITGAANVPFIAGEMLAGLVQSDPKRSAINNSVKELPNRKPFTKVVPSGGLKPDMDSVHFSAISQRVFGKRYYQIFSGNSLPPTPTVTPGVRFSIGFDRGFVTSDPLYPLVTEGNLTLVNDATRGQVGSFNGVDTAITIPYSITSSYTKSVWVKRRLGSTKTIGNFISYKADGYNHTFYFLNDKVQAGHGNVESVVTDPVNLPFDTWVHYVLTYEDTTKTMKLFKNGVLANSNTLAFNFSGITCATRIGAFGFGGDSYGFDGFIDDVKLFDYALSDADAAALT